MPCQLSWQLVSIKSQRLVHGLGAETAAAGGPFIGMMSAAHTSTAHEAPATARSIAVEIPIFVIRKSRDRNHCERFPHHDDFDLIPVARQATFGTLCQHRMKKPILWRLRDTDFYHLITHWRERLVSPSRADASAPRCY